MNPGSILFLASCGIDLFPDEVAPEEHLGGIKIMRRAERPKITLVVCAVDTEWPRVFDLKAGPGAASCPVGTAILTLMPSFLQNPLSDFRRHLAGHRRASPGLASLRFLRLLLLIARARVLFSCLPFSPTLPLPLRPLLPSFFSLFAEESIEGVVRGGSVG